MAAGGTQLKKVLHDDGIYVWKFHVNWADPSKTRLDGPVKVTVAPYRYLGGGQLTNCVPQPGTDRRLDAQGDKIMARLVYRRIGDRESIVAVHSVDTAAGGGGVRWYEFRLDKERNVRLHQQGTYCPGGDYRWMASPAIDAAGNIGIGYSFGGRSTSRGSGSPAGSRTTRRACSRCARRCWPRGRPRRRTRCGGRTTPRPRSTRATTAPSGTWATTSEGGRELLDADRRVPHAGAE